MYKISHNIKAIKFIMSINIIDFGHHGFTVKRTTSSFLKIIDRLDICPYPEIVIGKILFSINGIEINSSMANEDIHNLSAVHNLNNIVCVPRTTAYNIRTRQNTRDNIEIESRHGFSGQIQGSSFIITQKTILCPYPQIIQGQVLFSVNGKTISRDMTVEQLTNIVNQTNLQYILCMPISTTTRFITSRDSTVVLHYNIYVVINNDF